MRPDATSPFPSPFLGLPEAEWLCANDLAFAIFDSFPVSPGHVLAITRRVVPTYFDCTAAGQAALMELVGEVKRLLDQREPKPNGYNVGFNSGTAAGQTVPHVHVHVIPRYAGDMPDPIFGDHRREGHRPWKRGSRFRKFAPVPIFPHHRAGPAALVPSGRPAAGG
jgi:diadenosine tetraphosphate (Ap4A) HIT family hydrolase